MTYPPKPIFEGDEESERTKRVARALIFMILLVAAVICLGI